MENLNITKRSRKDSITDKELYLFAQSNPNIQKEKCHINAILVKEWLGTNAKIIIGHATLVENGIKRRVKNHLWNKYEPNLADAQLIDIENFLPNSKRKYIEHDGVELKLHDYMQDVLSSYEESKITN